MTIGELPPSSDGEPLLAVLTAVPDPAVEGRLVATFSHPSVPVTVARRCVDLPDLLAAAGTQVAQVAVVGADLPRLDRAALEQLARFGVAVVGLVRPGDEAAERRLRQLGIDVVTTTSTTTDDIVAALHQAIRRAAAQPTAAAGPSHALAGLPADLAGSTPASQPADQVGRVVAVWGPAGAPGRSTVALGLADAWAAAGRDVLLADVDPYGGALAPMLGLLDEAPGVLAACRAVNAGSLDVPRLAALCRQVTDRLRVLTGLPQASRWPELRAPALSAVLELARRLAEVVVVDTGFCLESDDPFGSTGAELLTPQRNAATLAALAAADVVLVVGSADPVGLSRLVRGWDELHEMLPDAPARLVLNRVRSGVLPGAARHPQREIARTVARFTGGEPIGYLPFDPATVDASLTEGQLLSHTNSDAELVRALADLAERVSADVIDSGPGAHSGRPSTGRRRRWRVKPRVGRATIP